MKNLIVKIMLLSGFINLIGCNCNKNPADWSGNKIDKWFEKSEWLNGWSVKPDPTINRKTFVVSYSKNKERWNSAFAFLKENDLTKLELKRMILMEIICLR